jgi:predicted metal-dependent hydrolase
VDVAVTDLGYRWGSARASDGARHINVHWAALQLPPSLIDYVIVHELAHLTVSNHTPEY